MNRRLLLLRHAKSSWAERSVTDIERPLIARGKRAAELIGAAMTSRGYVPDLILCSPSRRTRETLDAILPHFGANPPVVIADDLYESPHADYRPALAMHGGKAGSILLVGHNPTTQATALALAGSGDAGERKAMAAKFPTAALAVIEFPAGTEWAALPAGGGRLVTFLTPRQLGAADEG